MITNPHPHKELIIAWANGAKIQYRLNDFDEWHDLEHKYFENGAQITWGNPTWNPDIQYRIKPKGEHWGG